MPLSNAVSLSGQVLAMDRSPQKAIVVQAIRVADPSIPGRAALPRRPDITAERPAERQFSPTEDGKIKSLLPFFADYCKVPLRPGHKPY